MRSKLFPSQFAALLAVMCLIAPAQSCIWDRETLAAENTRLPGVIETMTGNFPRHSKEYHEWRKAQCEAALAKDPQQLALYDDLAVSQHKLGNHKAAIATMLAKEKIKPGLYETYSNLGTFLIYDDKVQEAGTWIAKALAINPEAHFGREKYQKWLVEWVLAGKVRDMNAGEFEPDGFAAFIQKQRKQESKAWTEKEQKEALRGLLGMMRFADFDNPLLLEALGDVLGAGKFQVGSLSLATQAYLLASVRSKDPAEKKRLVSLQGRAQSLLETPKITWQTLTPMLTKGQNQAEAIREQEKEWIAKGADVSLEYERKYLPPEKKP